MLVYKDILNEKQYEAVISQSKYNRIIAGAGSGKTRVLTYRIAYMIEKMNVDSKSILAITFTNKAAAEIRSRLSSIVGENSSRMTLSTFHAFAAKILRRNIDALGYDRNFTIIDEDDQRKIVKDIVKEVDKNKIIKDKEVISFISNVKGNTITADEATKHLPQNLSELEEEYYLYCYNNYQKYLKEHNYLDFDDLLLLALELFAKHPLILARWQSNYSHILVDEFQDINHPQYKLLEYFIEGGATFYVVGDPDQTIYTWRGANDKYIMQFDKNWPDANTIILNENYRSSQNILDIANSLIKNNYGRMEKDLFTNASRGEEINIYKAETTENEAHFVVRNILNLIHNKIKKTEIVILYRSNYLTRGIEKELLLNKIPYQIYGGLRFYDRKEIKDVLAYIKLILSDNDILSFERIINAPKRGIGEVTLAKIIAQAQTNNLPIYKYICDNIENLPLNKSQLIQIKLLTMAIKEARKSLAEHKTAIIKAMEKLLLNINYEDYLREIDNQDNDKVANRLENIKELLNDIENCYINDPDFVLSDYIQEAALYSELDRNANNNEAVTLMTVHTAKGLEFDNVFIYKFSDGIFPNMRSINEGRAGLLEERRLAYVAITRARERLFVSCSPNYSFEPPSRFYKEFNTINTNSNKTKDAPRVNPTLTINSSLWKLNEKINHFKFGEGIIVAIDGDILTIAFKNPSFGRKNMLASPDVLTKL